MICKDSDSKKFCDYNKLMVNRVLISSVNNKYIKIFKCCRTIEWKKICLPDIWLHYRIDPFRSRKYNSWKSKNIIQVSRKLDFVPKTYLFFLKPVGLRSFKRKIQTRLQNHLWWFVKICWYNFCIFCLRIRFCNKK